MKLKSIIPESIKKYLRYFLRKHKEYVWPKAINEYKSNVYSGQIPSRKLLKKVRYAWGNKGFSSKLDYLEACLQYAINSNGIILECGSGLSTILVGIIAKKQNRSVISLEHNEFWYELVRKEIELHALNSVKIYLTKIKDYDCYEWYDTSDIIINEIGLCICDGPPSNIKGGRKGFLYLLNDNLLPGAIILVDDTIREAENIMIDEWKKIKPMNIEYYGVHYTYAVLKIL
jgi:hypothetical protein